MFGCMLTSLGYRQPQLCLAVGLPPSGIALFIFGCMFTLSGIDSLSFVWLQTYLPREQIPFALFGAVFGCRFTPFGYRQHQLCFALRLPPLYIENNICSAVGVPPMGTDSISCVCLYAYPPRTNSHSCVWIQVYLPMAKIASAVFDCRPPGTNSPSCVCLQVYLPEVQISVIYNCLWLQTNLL